MMGLLGTKAVSFRGPVGFLMYATAPFHAVVATTTLWHSDAAIAGPFRTSIELLI
jgi:hypothetical protein